METHKTLKLGFTLNEFFKQYENFADATEIFTQFFSIKWNIHGRTLQLLKVYLMFHKQIFDQAEYVISYESDLIVDGIPKLGILKLVNQTAVDIGVMPVLVSELYNKSVDF